MGSISRIKNMFKCKKNNHVEKIAKKITAGEKVYNYLPDMQELMDLEGAMAEGAKKYSLELTLVKSVNWKESNFKCFAIRYEDHWKYFTDIRGNAKESHYSMATEKILQKCSVGPMQVMGGVARELGWKGNLLELTIPTVGVMLGCQHLANRIKKYGNVRDGLASYNAGDPKRKAGQAYASKVLAYMKTLKKEN